MELKRVQNLFSILPASPLILNLGQDYGYIIKNCVPKFSYIYLYIYYQYGLMNFNFFSGL